MNLSLTPNADFIYPFPSASPNDAPSSILSASQFSCPAEVRWMYAPSNFPLEKAKLSNLATQARETAATSVAANVFFDAAFNVTGSLTLPGFTDSAKLLVYGVRVGLRNGSFVVFGAATIAAEAVTITEPASAVNLAFEHPGNLTDRVLSIWTVNVSSGAVLDAKIRLIPVLRASVSSASMTVEELFCTRSISNERQAAGSNMDGGSTALRQQSIMNLEPTAVNIIHCNTPLQLLNLTVEAQVMQSRAEPLFYSDVLVTAMGPMFYFASPTPFSGGNVSDPNYLTRNYSLVLSNAHPRHTRNIFFGGSFPIREMNIAIAPQSGKLFAAVAPGIDGTAQNIVFEGGTLDTSMKRYTLQFSKALTFVAMGSSKAFATAWVALNLSSSSLPRDPMLLLSTNFALRQNFSANYLYLTIALPTLVCRGYCGNVQVGSLGSAASGWVGFLLSLSLVAACSYNRPLLYSNNGTYSYNPLANNIVNNSQKYYPSLIVTNASQSRHLPSSNILLHSFGTNALIFVDVSDSLQLWNSAGLNVAVVEANLSSSTFSVSSSNGFVSMIQPIASAAALAVELPRLMALVDENFYPRYYTSASLTAEVVSLLPVISSCPTSWLSPQQRPSTGVGGDACVFPFAWLYLALSYEKLPRGAAQVSPIPKLIQALDVSSSARRVVLGNVLVVGCSLAASSITIVGLRQLANTVPYNPDQTSAAVIFQTLLNTTLVADGNQIPLLILKADIDVRGMLYPRLTIDAVNVYVFNSVLRAQSTVTVGTTNFGLTSAYSLFRCQTVGFRVDGKVTFAPSTTASPITVSTLVPQTASPGTRSPLTPSLASSAPTTPMPTTAPVSVTPVYEPSPRLTVVLNRVTCEIRTTNVLVHRCSVLEKSQLVLDAPLLALQSTATWPLPTSISPTEFLFRVLTTNVVLLSCSFGPSSAQTLSATEASLVTSTASSLDQQGVAPGNPLAFASSFVINGISRLDIESLGFLGNATNVVIASSMVRRSLIKLSSAFNGVASTFGGVINATALNRGRAGNLHLDGASEYTDASVLLLEGLSTVKTNVGFSNYQSVEVQPPPPVCSAEATASDPLICSVQVSAFETAQFSTIPFANVYIGPSVILGSVRLHFASVTMISPLLNVQMHSESTLFWYPTLLGVTFSLQNSRFLAAPTPVVFQAVTNPLTATSAQRQYANEFALLAARNILAVYANLALRQDTRSLSSPPYLAVAFRLFLDNSSLVADSTSFTGAGARNVEHSPFPVSAQDLDTALGQLNVSSSAFALRFPPCFIASDAFRIVLQSSRLGASAGLSSRSINLLMAPTSDDPAALEAKFTEAMLANRYFPQLDQPISSKWFTEQYCQTIGGSDAPYTPSKKFELTLTASSVTAEALFSPSSSSTTIDVSLASNVITMLPAMVVPYWNLSFALDQGSQMTAQGAATSSNIVVMQRPAVRAGYFDISIATPFALSSPRADILQSTSSSASLDVALTISAGSSCNASSSRHSKNVFVSSVNSSLPFNPTVTFPSLTSRAVGMSAVKVTATVTGASVLSAVVAATSSAPRSEQLPLQVITVTPLDHMIAGAPGVSSYPTANSTTARNIFIQQFDDGGLSRYFADDTATRKGFSWQQNSTALLSVTSRSTVVSAAFVSDRVAANPSNDSYVMTTAVDLTSKLPSLTELRVGIIQIDRGFVRTAKQQMFSNGVNQSNVTTILPRTNDTSSALSACILAVRDQSSVQVMGELQTSFEPIRSNQSTANASATNESVESSFSAVVQKLPRVQLAVVGVLDVIDPRSHFGRDLQNSTWVVTPGFASTTPDRSYSQVDVQVQSLSRLNASLSVAHLATRFPLPISTDLFGNVVTMVTSANRWTRFGVGATLSSKMSVWLPYFPASDVTSLAPSGKDLWGLNSSLLPNLTASDGLALSWQDDTVTSVDVTNSSALLINAFTRGNQLVPMDATITVAGVNHIPFVFPPAAFYHTPATSLLFATRLAAPQEPPSVPGASPLRVLYTYRSVGTLVRVSISQNSTTNISEVVLRVAPTTKQAPLFAKSVVFLVAFHGAFFLTNSTSPELSRDEFTWWAATPRTLKHLPPFRSLTLTTIAPPLSSLVSLANSGPAWRVTIASNSTISIVQQSTMAMLGCYAATRSAVSTSQAALLAAANSLDFVGLEVIASQKSVIGIFRESPYDNPSGAPYPPDSVMSPFSSIIALTRVFSVPQATVSIMSQSRFTAGNYIGGISIDEFDEISNVTVVCTTGCSWSAALFQNGLVVRRLSNTTVALVRNITFVIISAPFAAFADSIVVLPSTNCTMGIVILSWVKSSINFTPFSVAAVATFDLRPHPWAPLGVPVSATLQRVKATFDDNTFTNFVSLFSPQTMPLAMNLSTSTVTIASGQWIIRGSAGDIRPPRVGLPLPLSANVVMLNSSLLDGSVRHMLGRGPITNQQSISRTLTLTITASMRSSTAEVTATDTMSRELTSTRTMSNSLLASVTQLVSVSLPSVSASVSNSIFLRGCPQVSVATIPAVLLDTHIQDPNVEKFIVLSISDPRSRQTAATSSPTQRNVTTSNATTGNVSLPVASNATNTSFLWSLSASIGSYVRFSLVPSSGRRESLGFTSELAPLLEQASQSNLWRASDPSFQEMRLPIPTNPQFDLIGDEVVQLNLLYNSIAGGCVPGGANVSFVSADLVIGTPRFSIASSLSFQLASASGTFSTVGGSLGSILAFAGGSGSFLTVFELQVLAMLGSMNCATADQIAYANSLRYLLSPFSNLGAKWVSLGGTIIGVVIGGTHLALVFTYCWKTRFVSFVEGKSLFYFPSLSYSFISWLLCGVVCGAFRAARKDQDTDPSVFASLVGIAFVVCFISYIGHLMFRETGSVLEFRPYPPRNGASSEAEGTMNRGDDAHPVVRLLFLPWGAWVAKDSPNDTYRNSYKTVFLMFRGGYRMMCLVTQLHVVIMGILASYQFQDSSCYLQYVLMASLQGIMTLVYLATRPFRSVFLNVVGITSHALLTVLLAVNVVYSKRPLASFSDTLVGLQLGVALLAVIKIGFIAAFEIVDWCYWRQPQPGPPRKEQEMLYFSSGETGPPSLPVAEEAMSNKRRRTLSMAPAALRRNSRAFGEVVEIEEDDDDDWSDSEAEMVLQLHEKITGVVVAPPRLPRTLTLSPEAVDSDDDVL